MNEYDSLCFCFCFCFCVCGWGCFMFCFIIWGFVSSSPFLLRFGVRFASHRGGRYIFIFIFIFIYTEKLIWAIMAGRFSLFFSILILLILFFYIVLYLSVFLFWPVLLLCWVSNSGQLRLFPLQFSLSYPIILYPMQIPLFSILFFSRLLTLHKTLQVFNSHILFTILIYLNLSFFSPLFIINNIRVVALIVFTNFLKTIKSATMSKSN